MRHRLAVGIVFFFTIAGGASQAARKSVWDRVYTFEQAGRGKTLYGAHCASCHGDHLEGTNDPYSAQLSPGKGRALAGPYFQADYRGQSLRHLSDRIRVTMPFGNPGILTRAEVLDITAYILSANGFPDGSTELTDNLRLLDEITIGR
jgi:S-disulfanyl-L-cysteine oxidoreductase SoxD